MVLLISAVKTHNNNVLPFFDTIQVHQHQPMSLTLYISLTYLSPHYPSPYPQLPLATSNLSPYFSPCSTEFHGFPTIPTGCEPVTAFCRNGNRLHEQRIFRAQSGEMVCAEEDNL